MFGSDRQRPNMLGPNFAHFPKQAAQREPPKNKSRIPKIANTNNAQLLAGSNNRRAFTEADCTGGNARSHQPIKNQTPKQMMAAGGNAVATAFARSSSFPITFCV